jgi:hypothetical protein
MIFRARVSHQAGEVLAVSLVYPAQSVDFDYPLLVLCLCHHGQVWVPVVPFPNRWYAGPP